MKKYFSFLIIISFSVHFSMGQAIQFSSTAGNIHDDAWATSTIDSMGNIYMAGLFSDSVRIGDTLIIKGYELNFLRLWIVKLNSNGELIWDKVDNRPSGYLNRPFKMRLDNNNDLVLSYWGSSQINFENNTFFGDSAACSILKMDKDGNLLKKKSFRNPESAIACYFWVKDFCFDKDNNVNFIATLSGKVLLNKVNQTDTILGGSSAYSLFGKFNQDFEVVWFKELYQVDSGYFSQQNVFINGCSTDKENNLVIVGSSYDTVYLNYEKSRFISNKLKLDRSFWNNGWIIKTSNEGNYLWGKVIQGLNSQSTFNSITTDRYNNILVSGFGFTQDPVYLESDTGNFYGKQSGISIIKFRPDGNPFLLTSTDISPQALGAGTGENIVADSAGNIYIAAPFAGLIDFDPGLGTRLFWATGGQINIGFLDIAVIKYSKDLKLLWVTRTTASGFDKREYLDFAYCQKTNSMMVCGDYNGTMTFNSISNPSYPSYNADLGSNGKTDGYYAKIKNNCLSRTQVRDTICFGSTKAFDGETLTKPGKYIRLKSYNASTQCEVWEELYLHVRPELSASAGKDSTLCAGKKLTLGTDSIIKTTFNWQQIGGNSTSTKAKPNIHFENNSDTLQTYTYAYLANQQGTGCQKKDTVSIKVLPRKRSVLSQAICKGQSFLGYDTAGVYFDTLFSQSGCDSIRTLTLSIKPIQTKSQTVNLCQGQTLQVGTRTYNAPGIYVDTLTASNGCDSIITSTLNYSIPNDTILLNGLYFTAADNQDSYQWLDCNQGFQAISGATQQSFTPTNNGSYAVRATKGNCADTSNCVLFTSGKDLLTNQIRIYPQPVKDKLYIDLPETGQTTELVLMDALGRIVAKEKGRKISSISVLRLPAGLYQLKVKRGNGVEVFGVVVEK